MPLAVSAMHDKRERPLPITLYHTYTCVPVYVRIFSRIRYVSGSLLFCHSLSQTHSLLRSSNSKQTQKSYDINSLNIIVITIIESNIGCFCVTLSTYTERSYIICIRVYIDIFSIAYDTHRI